MKKLLFAIGIAAYLSIIFLTSAEAKRPRAELTVAGYQMSAVNPIAIGATQTLVLSGFHPFEGVHSDISLASDCCRDFPLRADTNGIITLSWTQEEAGTWKVRITLGDGAIVIDETYEVTP